MKDNCNLTTCRYNEDGKCTNEEKTVMGFMVEK